MIQLLLSCAVVAWHFLIYRDLAGRIGAGGGSLHDEWASLVEAASTNGAPTHHFGPTFQYTPKFAAISHIAYEIIMFSVVWF